uniref:hypothetical protein n=1 Tax=Streptobacillus moniliformis TaxID=34105 RepID=UPI000A60D8D7
IIDLNIIDLNMKDRQEIILKLNNKWEENLKFLQGLDDFHFNYQKSKLCDTVNISNDELLKRAYSYGIIPLGFFLKKISELKNLDNKNIESNVRNWFVHNINNLSDDELNKMKELVEPMIKIIKNK